MAGKGGGAWKVAYADFVTAMMAFFLVMWIVAQSKPVREAVAGYFKNPTGTSILPGKSAALGPRKEGGTAPVAPNRLYVATLRPQSRSDDPAAELTDENVTVRNRIALGIDKTSTIGTQIVFSDQAADLDERGRRALDHILPALLGKALKIEIRGHASGSSVPEGSPYKNVWELSYARCTAVMNYLVEKGIDGRRFRLSQSGPNDVQLLGPSTEGLNNSRVELYVLNEVVADPSELGKANAGPAKKKMLPKFSGKALLRGPKPPGPSASTVH